MGNEIHELYIKTKIYHQIHLSKIILTRKILQDIKLSVSRSINF